MRCFSVSGFTPAHLRASGGTLEIAGVKRKVSGASPRERRNRMRTTALMVNPGRISARAEEPHHRVVQIKSQKAHLRASGGTSAKSSVYPFSAGASPRERRNQLRNLHSIDHRRRISARAEEP